MVLCRLELTLLNMSFPTMVAMVGKTRAPHRILVADTWSASGLASAGIRGTGQPIPAHTHTRAASSTHCCPYRHRRGNRGIQRRVLGPGKMLLRICSLFEYFLHRRRT